MELPFEREAMSGKKMPSGLDLSDQKMYQALSFLYKRYYLGYITREQAKTDKEKLIYQYRKEKDQAKFEIEICRKRQNIIKNIEIAASNYAKEKSIENAEAFYNAIYNLL